MQFRNIVIIDGKEVDLKTLPLSERKDLRIIGIVKPLKVWGTRKG